jgi:choline dehydrogenase-like flavoprotein
MNLIADAVVIGAGIVGSSCAHALARAGLSVHLVERIGKFAEFLDVFRSHRGRPHDDSHARLDSRLAITDGDCRGCARWRGLGRGRPVLWRQ